MDLSLNCVVYAEENFLIPCLKKLMNTGPRILGIISSDSLIQSWGASNQILVIHSISDWQSNLKGISFDYLFLLGEDVPVSDDIQAQARRGTYRYKQRSRLESFNELLRSLGSDHLSSDSSRAEQRHPVDEYSESPIIRWHQEAERILAGLNKPEPKELGHSHSYVKLLMQEEAYLVSHLQMLNYSSVAVPGTLVHVDEDHLQVTTGTQDVVIPRIYTLEGHRVSLFDFVTHHGLMIGSEFPELPPERSKAIASITQTLEEQKDYWVRKLSFLKLYELPFTSSTNGNGCSCVFANIPFEVPDEIISFGKRLNGNLQAADFLSIAFIAYILRITERQEIDVLFRDSTLHNLVNGQENIFSSHVPAHFLLSGFESFQEFHISSQKEIQQVRQSKTYSKDLIARYAPLEYLKHNPLHKTLPVQVEQVRNLDDWYPFSQTSLTFLVKEDGSACQWVYQPKKWEEKDILRMQEDFRTLLTQILHDPYQPLRRDHSLPVFESRGGERPSPLKTTGSNALNHTYNSPFRPATRKEFVPDGHLLSPTHWESNYLQQILRTLWQEALHVPAIGVHDHFFEIGGNQISALRLLASIRELLGVNLELAQLYQAPTIKALADLILHLQIRQNVLSLVPERMRLVS